MKAQKILSNSSISSWVLLPLRLFLGVTFIYAGMQKFTDPQFFHPAKAAFIGKQLAAFAVGSPIHGLLVNVVVPHAMLFGYIIAYGEIAIGLGTLVGFLLRPAAFFGMLLSLAFFLSASWHVYPYFYGSDIVFVFCWITLLLNGPLNTGLPTLDEFLTFYFLQHSGPVQQTGLAAALHFIVGTRIQSQEEPRTLVAEPATHDIQQKGSQQHNRVQQRRQSAIQRAEETRRSFLKGTLTGSGVVFTLGLVIYAYRVFFFSPGDSTTNTTSQNASTSGNSNDTATTTPATTQTGSSTSAIAQVKSVPVNSSTAFTLPSSGDPGILIHLNNDQFVAYDAVCTHAGCQVNYDPDQQLMVCPCHGAAFDPTKSAAVVNGPASIPLSSVTIHIDSATGNITLS